VALFFRLDLGTALAFMLFGIKKGDKMIRFSVLKNTLALCLTVLACQAFAEPDEVKVLTLNRTSTTDLTMTGSLSQNVYHDEEYQANYTVSIPYEEEETYQEAVPYTVTVPYTDYVTDYRSEYQCHSVTHYREECRQVTHYRQQCHNEVQCHTVPGDRTCHDVTECGTNVHGQPICKTRTVCEQGSSQQRCENRQVCSSEPYSEQECRNVPYSEQECGNVQVPYQREVTRYREETRYNYVTKTRMVTKYREETRCCVTKTRPVFDKQLAFTVTVHIPENAVLAAGETEQLNIILESADDNSATVSLEANDTIWGYSIASQTVTGSHIEVVLAAKAQWDQTTAGQASIKRPILNWAPSVKYFQFSFTDLVQSPKIKSTYKVTLLDLTGKKLDEKIPTADANGLVNFIFTNFKDQKTPVKAVLEVSRAGTIIDGKTVHFQMELPLTVIP
jgi:hypothetical protein